jgi:hypothetical protein
VSLPFRRSSFAGRASGRARGALGAALIAAGCGGNEPSSTSPPPSGIDGGASQDGAPPPIDSSVPRPDGGDDGGVDAGSDGSTCPGGEACFPVVTPNPNYPGSRAPLAPTPFLPLPVGAVRAEGWLLKQLELQRDGLTGAAESLYAELGASSPWRGGSDTSQAWGERAPYYVKGLVALAYVLDDAPLEAKAKAWIDWTLDHQGADGYLGPAQLASAGDGMNMWGRVPMLYALKDYAEATGDPRVEPALTSFFHWEAANLASSPLTSWARSRAGDIVDVVHWLYDRTGEASLLAHSDALRAAAYPFTSIYAGDSFLSDNGDFQPKHNVNVQEDIKAPAILSRRTLDDADRNAFLEGHDHLFHRHGQAHGAEAGNEMLSGDSSTSGIELCSIVERMQSDEEAQMILGEPALGDQLERLAFNALPGAITKDYRALQYFTLPNQVESTHGPHGYEQDYGNGITPSPSSGYPCCRFNMHMGWPYFVKNMWAATADSGLAIMAYGPSRVQAKVANGALVTITEDTAYPFEDQVRLTVHTAQPVGFPLSLRIPAWSSAPAVHVGGVARTGVTAGAFYVVRRLWSDGDVVTIDLPADLRTSPWVQQSVSVERGPLVFSLELAEHMTASAPGGDLGQGVTPQTGFNELEITSDSPWRYALMLDPANPAATLGVQTRAMPDNPFVQSTTPVYLQAKAKLVSYWGMDSANGTVAAEPPFPAVSTSPTVDVRLVPFGAENIRVTYFPLAVAEGARFEAESGALAGGAVTNTDHPGYSGTGFVDFKSTNGANVSLPLTGSSPGLQYLTVRYAAGAGATSGTSIAVDGTALPAVTFPGTADWNTWADSPPMLVSLGAASAIKIANAGGPPINVDYVSLTPFRGAFYEAEGATLAGGATVMSDHPRYSGTGFVDFKATSGASVSFDVKAATAGPHTVIVRYGAGSGAPVTGVTLVVNGVQAPATTFASTGAWNIWQSSEPQVVTLNAGSNAVQLVNGAAPYLNVDSITVLPGAQLPCVRAVPSATIAPPLGSAPVTGGAATYTVTVTSRDSAACPATPFHLEAATLGLGGATFAFATNDVALAPGASATSALTVTSPAGASAATYAVSTWARNAASAEAAIATAGIELH